MGYRLSTTERLALISRWRAPASPAETARQERAERMVKEAIRRHRAFEGVSLSVSAKGSYPNNTNVRADSDVDIKIQCNELHYYEGPFTPPGSLPRYTGPWTPELLRLETQAALEDLFQKVDTGHNVAFHIPELLGSRPSTDVVPCFEYVYYPSADLVGGVKGSIVHCVDGTRIVNWPELQLHNGQAKNARTGHRYKHIVRILKSVENDMVATKLISPIPSYVSECLIYNVPDSVLKEPDSMDTAVKAALLNVYGQVQDEARRAQMIEPNEMKKLFEPGAKWKPEEIGEFIALAWGYLGYEAES